MENNEVKKKERKLLHQKVDLGNSMIPQREITSISQESQKKKSRIKGQMVYVNKLQLRTSLISEGNRHLAPRATENSPQNQQKPVNTMTYHSESCKIQR